MFGPQCPIKGRKVFSDRLDDAQVRSESFRPIGKYSKYSWMVREYLNVYKHSQRQSTLQDEDCWVSTWQHPSRKPCVQKYVEKTRFQERKYQLHRTFVLLLTRAIKMMGPAYPHMALPTAASQQLLVIKQQKVSRDNKPLVNRADALILRAIEQNKFG